MSPRFRAQHAGRPGKAGRARYRAVVDLGPIGVWWSGSWRAPDDLELDAPHELRWLRGAVVVGALRPGARAPLERLLAATSHVPVASGVVSIWHGAPADVGPRRRRPRQALRGSLRPRPRRQPHAPDRALCPPLHAHMVAYLDALDTLETPVPPERRVLAALRPHARAGHGTRRPGRTPYFVPVEHTAKARGILGPGPLLAPEVAVVLETDPARAREVARGYTTGYLTLPNYSQNLRDLGYGDDDVAGGGSDRLVDAVIAWGDAAAVAEQASAGAAATRGRTTSASKSSPTTRRSRSPPTARLAATLF